MNAQCPTVVGSGYVVHPVLSTLLCLAVGRPLAWVPGVAGSVRSQLIRSRMAFSSASTREDICVTENSLERNN